MQYNYIAIEGTMGAGKTTLSSMISKDFNGKLILEEFEPDKNPFLAKFYNESGKYAFQMEMTFLALRFQQLKDKLLNFDLFHNFIISDYYVAKSLIFSKETLQPDEYDLFARFFNIVFANIPRPELLVYLHLDVPHLQANIHKRGREYEQNIHDSYLEHLQQGYFDFIKQQTNMRILILNTNNIDFVANRSDYEKIIDVINRPYDIGVHRMIL